MQQSLWSRPSAEKFSSVTACLSKLSTENIIHKTNNNKRTLSREETLFKGVCKVQNTVQVKYLLKLLVEKTNSMNDNVVVVVVVCFS